MTGKTLLHYKILSKVGSGGMGDVYEAEDTKLHRKVALKTLPGDLSGDPERLARFQREATAIAEEQGFPIQLLVAEFARVWADSETDLGDREIENLLAEFQQAIDQLATTGTRVGAPQILAILAETTRNFDRHTEALGHIDGPSAKR